MIEPYRMVLINLIASSITIGALLFYRYIYPKRKIRLSLILVILSLLPLISILRKGSYESGDLSLHVKIAMQFYETLIDGNLIPQWAARHCAGYGCPVYLFLYPLPYYIISFFHFLGFTFINSTKLLLFFSFLLSGLLMYLWIKEELGKTQAFISSLFYVFSPYHLIITHFRVSIGESLSFLFLPLCFYSIKKSIETSKIIFLLLSAMVISLLILSHQVTSLASFPLLIIYGIIVWSRTTEKKLKNILNLPLLLLIGLLISAFYWVPIMFEGKYTWYSSDINSYGMDFKPFFNFIYSPYRFGLLFQGNGDLIFLLGYAQLLIILISFYLICRNKIQKRQKKLFLFLIISFIFFFFLMQSISKPIWENIVIIKNFQFSWRLSIQVALLVSVLAGIIVDKYKNKYFIIFLCIFVIFPTILNWGNRKSLPISDDSLKKEHWFQEFPGGVDLTTPRWVDKNQPWIGKQATTHLEILKGTADIKEVSRNSTNHLYLVNALEDIYLKENTYYFPGWTVKANDSFIPINYSNKQYKGVITFNLKKGTYKINVALKDTKIRSVAKWISLMTFFSFLLITAYSSINNLFRKKSNYDN